MKKTLLLRTMCKTHTPSKIDWLFSPLLLLLLMVSGVSWGQVANYTFSQSNGTYTAITGGTAHNSSATDNANYSFTLPFTFTYNGTGYTVARPTTNGFLVLGGNAPSTSQYTPLSSGSTNFAISGFGADLRSIVRSEVLGTFPNRVYVCQWSSVERWTSLAWQSDAMNFQIRLYETTNVIEIVYGSNTGTSTSSTVQVGLRGSANTDYNNRSSTTNWSSTTSGSSNAASVTYSSTIKPTSGLTFTWTPSTSPYVSATAVTAFGNVCTNTTVGPNSTTITGGNLTGNITLGALAGFSYCTTSGGTYTSTLDLTPSSGSVNQVVYIKFNPTAVQSYSGNIPITGGGLAATVNVAVTGAGVNSAPTVSVNGTAGSITTTGATISGSTISALGCSSVTAYGIEYSTTSGFTNGTGTQVAGTGFSGSAGGTFSTALTGLSSATTYYYKAYATNSGGTTYYSTQSSFTTACNAISSFPWTDGFESLSTTGSGVVPTCWKNVTGTYSWTASNTATTTYNDPRTGTYYETIEWSNTTASYLWTPGFQLSAGVSYDFSFYFVGDAYSGWTGDVVYNSSQSSTGATALGSSFITSGTTSSTTYAKVLRSFTPPSSGVYYFAVKVVSNSTPYYLGVDDFTLELTPTCVAPASVSASTTITSSTATINWTASTSNPSSGYEWEVRTSGAGGSGATGLAASGTVAAGVLTANVTGLTAATSYTVYVRANCGAGDYSTWASGGAFTTECSTITSLPFIETFETASTTLSCWRVRDGNSDGDMWALYTTYPHNGTQSAGIYTDTNTSNQDYFISPKIQLTGNQRLKFWVRAYSTSEPDEISVKLSNTNNAIASFTTTVMASTSINFTTYTEYTVNLSAYTGDFYIAFVRENSPADGWYLYLDDVTVENIPTDTMDWANLQYISNTTPQTCQSVDVYTRGYEPGVTNAVGQGSGITVWVGKNTADTDPATWAESKWTAATYFGDANGLGANDNDEYKLTLSGLTAGTYYISTRWQLNGGPYRYGATNDGFWDGSTHTNAVLTVSTPLTISISPSSPSMCSGGSPVSLTASSSDTTYTYAWNNGAGTGATVNVSPASTTTYTVTGTNSAGCTATATVTVTVNSAPTAVVVTTADATICGATVQTLTATGGQNSINATIGSGTDNPSTTSYPNPFSAFYGGVKHQMIYDASELTAQGLQNGSSIKTISFNLSAFVANACTDLTIRMKNTTSTTLTTFETGTTTVYGATTFTPSATGWVTFTLTTPFVWDSSKNLLVEVVHNAGNGGNGSGTRSYCTITTGNKTYYGAKDSVAGGIAGFDALSSYTTSGGSTSRPNAKFGFEQQQILWSASTSPTYLYTNAGCTTPYDGISYATTLYAKPIVTTTYTATATNGSCSNADGVTFTIDSKTWDGVWSGDGNDPVTGQTAIIDGTLTLPANITACSCIVKSGKTLTIPAGKTLTVENTISNEGTVIIEDTGSLLQTNTGADANSGSGTYQVYKKSREYAEYDYNYWSSPVVGETAADAVTTNSSVAVTGAATASTTGSSLMYYYVPGNYNDANNDVWDDDSNEWVAASGTLTAGKGFIAMGAGADFPFSTDFDSGTFQQTVHFDGTNVNNGDLTITLTHDIDTSTTESDNLIGNPYPSAIDATKLYTENSSKISSSAFFWTHDRPIDVIAGAPWAYAYDNADYSSLNLASGVGSGANSVTPNKFVASGQGFMVQLLDTAADGIITLKNSMREAGSNTYFMRDPQTYDAIWLNLTDNAGLYRQIAISFIENASNTFDVYDTKRLPYPGLPDFYSIPTGSNEKLAIQGLAPFSLDRVIPLGITTTYDNTYQISLDRTQGIFGEGQAVYLKDNLTGVIHDFNEGSYSFTQAIASDLNDRFEIVFTSTMATDTISADSFTVYPNPSKGIFNINSRVNGAMQINVYDVTGKWINAYQFDSATHQSLDLSGLQSGVYLAKITANGSTVTKKLVIE